MTTETPDLLNAIAETNRLIERLNDAFNIQEWDKVEVLINKRDLAATRALPPELPDTLQDQANELIEKIRDQNRRLTEAAKTHHIAASDELMQRRNQKKNIEAYKPKK